ncbi:hypothetical protein GMORB2_4018 [Geosmithia morbida]|uniref:Uncharacterized protein n=1 Tax=Geosmithia morbida TaxID=1094350 RepID=A0A9P5D853_9HYPO|nr:uncharacterized protein GMORB2_4018 [Geosmithia morbida]KAF4125179.1 hypothetical protein GMORB2_4018 [Geosmithia morbida]
MSDQNNFLRLTPERQHRRPSTFLTLAPSTSSSYPRMAKSRVSSRKESIDSETSVASPDSVTSSPPPVTASRPGPSAAAMASAAAHARRRSSTATDVRGEVRMLKLGPVHWGEHLGDHKEDFCEM